MTKELAQKIHAALLKQAHDLAEQRAAVLQQAAAYEQEFGFRRNASEKLENIAEASYAGVTET